MDLAWFNIKHDTVDQKLSTNLKNYSWYNLVRDFSILLYSTLFLYIFFFLCHLNEWMNEGHLGRDMQS